MSEPWLNLSEQLVSMRSGPQLRPDTLFSSRLCTLLEECQTLKGQPDDLKLTSPSHNFPPTLWLVLTVKKKCEASVVDPPPPFLGESYSGGSFLWGALCSRVLVVTQIQVVTGSESRPRSSRNWVSPPN